MYRVFCGALMLKVMTTRAVKRWIPFESCSRYQPLRTPIVGFFIGGTSNQLMRYGILWCQIVRFHVVNFRNSWLLRAVRVLNRMISPQPACAGVNQGFLGWRVMVALCFGCCANVFGLLVTLFCFFLQVFSRGR